MPIPREQIGIETLRRMRTLDAYNHWMIDRIRPFIGDTVLEVGAGIGNMSRFFLDAKRLILTDRDPRCLDVLRGTFAGYDHVSCERYDLESSGEHLRDRGVDTVIALNVLEHIEHDEHALAGIAAILAPGGQAIFQLPAHRLLYGTLDRNLDHFRRYSVRDIRNKFTRAGLMTERIERVNMPGAVGWFVCSRILEKQILPGGSLGLFNRLTPLFIAIEKAVPAPFGLSIIAVARKPV